MRKLTSGSLSESHTNETAKVGSGIHLVINKDFRDKFFIQNPKVQLSPQAPLPPLNKTYEKVLL